MKEKRFGTLILLHLMLMIYSLSGICSKKASQEAFLNIRFCVYYGMIIFLLGFYAIGWQQIIKRLPLTTAYANKAVTVIWGIVWGTVFFHETITIGKALGAILVVIGVALFATSDKEKE